MKDIDLHIVVKSCEMDELPSADRELIDEARRATNHAYARYSGFKVGAAARLANGKIVIGANQENAAFPSGLCAERSAIFAAQSQYPDQPITTLAVAACNGKGFLADPVTPCGACRQVMLEIEDRYKQPVRILLFGTERVYILQTVRDLLPLSFVDESMR